MSTYTAIFPTRSAHNLEHCVNSLIKNSLVLSEVIVVWDGNKDLLSQLPKFAESKVPVRYVPNTGLDVYGMFNYGVQLCKTEYVLLVNDDMYFPSEWDNKLQLSHDSVITFLVVEPGWVDVNEKNIHKDFGMNWHTFKAEEFEAFATGYKKRNSTLMGKLGWYMPVVFPKALFIEAGQYPTEPPFPEPNDIKFFELLKANPKVKFVQITSPVYHFQRLSQRVEGEQPQTQKPVSLKRRAKKWLASKRSSL
jgi:hypothetical protein